MRIWITGAVVLVAAAVVVAAWAGTRAAEATHLVTGDLRAILSVAPSRPAGSTYGGPQLETLDIDADEALAAAIHPRSGEGVTFVNQAEQVIAVASIVLFDDAAAALHALEPLREGSVGGEQDVKRLEPLGLGAGGWGIATPAPLVGELTIYGWAQGNAVALVAMAGMDVERSDVAGFARELDGRLTGA